MGPMPLEAFVLLPPSLFFLLTAPVAFFVTTAPVLAQLCTVSCIHSVLKMDQERATRRMITAIEHPCTDILGHPTGRLLLAREGYPIDHKQVIDACAEHNVAIELNANPLRLDMDYSWIPYAMEKGVMWAINPDAHSRESIHNVRFGVLAARKGGLVTTLCLNALGREDFARWLASRRA